jgi:tetratricopeptide (TPR) repeat protein
MIMTSKKGRFAAVVALLLAGAAGSALAMGSGPSGGGGSMSGGATSAPGPQYDPVQEYQSGVADLKAGRYKEAVREFEHVTDAQPRVANAWYMLGLAKAGTKDVKGASKAYEKAVKLDPAPVAPLREYALSLAELKQTDKANAQLAALKTRAATCADSCPDAADLKAAVSAVEQAMTSGSPAAMLSVPSSLIFASSQQGDAAYVRAVSLINEHRFTEALASLSEAEKVFGPHPDILTYEGYAWRKKGDYAKAETYYRQALAIDPTHVGATEYYGELKVARGDVAGARVMLARLDKICTFGCADAEELRRWIDAGGDPQKN